MTSDEAIDIIKSECYVFNPFNFDRSTIVNTKLDMAIKALEQQPCEDTISRQAAIDAIMGEPTDAHYPSWYAERLEQLPSAQPDTEKICARIKAEAIKRNVEYMKHGDRYMLGFVDGMRLARRIVDGTVDDPVYFTTSGE